MTRYTKRGSPTGRRRARGEILTEAEIAAAEATDPDAPAWVEPPSLTRLKNLVAQWNAEEAAHDEAWRTDPALRRRERLAALAPPPGRHPLDDGSVREVLERLAIALADGDRAEWARGRRGLVSLLLERLRPREPLSPRDPATRDRYFELWRWEIGLAEALTHDFEAPPHRARKTLQLRDDVDRLDGWAREELNTAEAAAYLARKHRISIDAARKRVKRACAEGGFGLRPAPRGGSRRKKG